MRCAADLAAGDEAAAGEPVERDGESEPTPKPWRTATGRAAAANDSAHGERRRLWPEI